MVKYIDDGVLLGWYFCREGCCWGDGTKKTAERIEKEMTEDGRQKQCKAEQSDRAAHRTVGWHGAWVLHQEYVGEWC